LVGIGAVSDRVSPIYEYAFNRLCEGCEGCETFPYGGYMEIILYIIRNIFPRI